MTSTYGVINFELLAHKVLPLEYNLLQLPFGPLKGIVDFFGFCCTKIMANNCTKSFPQNSSTPPSIITMMTKFIEEFDTYDFVEDQFKGHLIFVTCVCLVGMLFNLVLSLCSKIRLK